VVAAADAARDAGADLLLSLGGGTPIDCTKAVALCLAADVSEASQLDDLHIRFTYPDDIHRPALPDSPLPHVSIPTTLSGSEHTNLFGVTDDERQVKDLYSGAGFVPSAVVLDPEFAMATPADLWGASGVRAIDHAVEGILSRRHVPFMDALGLEALRILRDDLVAGVRDPDDVRARGSCLLAAWLAIYGLTNVGTGLSHACGHQLAAAFDIMHGVTSAIMLPHVMRFNAPMTAERMARIAEPLGQARPGLSVDESAARAIDGVAGLIAELEPYGVPHELHRTGAVRSELPAIADRVLHDMGAAVNPRPVERADLLTMLESAW
jgi:alcohol dehydrogenase